MNIILTLYKSGLLGIVINSGIFLVAGLIDLRTRTIYPEARSMSIMRGFIYWPALIKIFGCIAVTAQTVAVIYS